MTDAVLGARVARGRLQYDRLKDANVACPGEVAVASCRFHPSGHPVLFTAGADRMLRLFKVDGEVNPVLQTVFTRDLPVTGARYLEGGREVMLVGKRKHYYTFDLEDGQLRRIPPHPCFRGQCLDAVEVSPDGRTAAVLLRDGTVQLINARTKQPISALQASGKARRISFAGDGRGFLTAGHGDGKVYYYDLRSLRCVHAHVDEGCVKSTALAGAPNGVYATGQDSGVVNLYDADAVMPGMLKAAAAAASRWGVVDEGDEASGADEADLRIPRDGEDADEGDGGWGGAPGAKRGAGAGLYEHAPEPALRLLNLTTQVDVLRFSPDASMLAFASTRKREAIRIVHVPTGTVYKNFPSTTGRSGFGYVTDVDFSPDGSKVACGNAHGQVLLYRLGKSDIDPVALLQKRKR